MAGAGWRDFVPGEVLTAANVQDYLQDQAVMVFASAAARTSALASPSEGMVSFLQDTNTIQVYLTSRSPSGWYDVSAASLPADARKYLEIGLVPIVPTSVGISAGSSSISTNGRVTFSGTNYVDLRGVFTSTFKDYHINLVIKTTSADTEYRLTFLTGTTADAGNKQTAGFRFSTDATSSTQNCGTFTYHYLSSADSGSFSGMATSNIEVFQPQAATFTTVHSNTMAMSAAGLTTAYLMDTRTNGGDQFTGVRVISSAGGSTISGEIAVLGYQDGM